MRLEELIAYAKEKYGIEEMHKWADFPGFSVLAHPQTGKWVALLMRQWDTDTGTEIERCDLKCGRKPLYDKPYISPPIRMRGDKWVDIAFDGSTERDVVFRLFDEAIASGRGYTIVLNSLSLSGADLYRETALPFAGSAYKPEREAVPDRLREMRRIYEYGRESEEFRAKNFYRQAVFMQDYEDDEPWIGNFFCYFPTYRDMTMRQLRGYFTWRAGVRRGDFQPVPDSAAYIYIYELLNGVGAASPEDTLKKLREFESGFIDPGFGDKRMRTNLRRWMLEFAVISGLPPELVREYIAPETAALDNSLAVLRRPEEYSDDEVFAALCFFGGKKTADSPVVRLDPERGKRLFSEAWRSASAYRSEGKRLFNLCFGEKKTRRWYPLSHTVYYERQKPEDRDCVINECRSFRCRGGLWTVRAYEALSFDKSVLHGFLREADARGRRYLKTGSYLKEKPENAWAAPYIDSAIEKDKKAQAEAARPKLTLDLSGLDKIRRDAAATRDSLLTEEELAEPEESTPAEAEENLPLDAVQLRILCSLLRGEDAAAILKSNHLMPSMAADAINDALYDEIGDTVLLCEDDKLMLVDDYTEELKEILGGTRDG